MKNFSVWSLSSLLSVFVLMSGIWMSYMSDSVMGLWVGSEVSFLGGINLLSGDSVLESEKTMQYFIIQVVGSIFWCLGCLMTIYCNFPMMVESLSYMGICMKLGVFPFCFWVAGVMRGLSWCGCFVVSVLYKLMPLVFMFNMNCFQNEGWGLEFLAIATVLYGCYGGLCLEDYKALIGYSSLVHLGFMMMLGLCNMWYFIIYWLVYMLMMGGLMLSLWFINVDCCLDLVSFYPSIRWLDIPVISIYFVSLCGVPPFTGFFLKLLFLYGCWEYFPVGVAFCFIISILSIFYYSKVLVDMNACYIDSSFGRLKFNKLDWADKDLVIYLLYFMSVWINLFLGVLGYFVVCKYLV